MFFTSHRSKLRFGLAPTQLSRSLLPAAAAVMLLLPGAAHAQLSGKGEVKGVVADPTGAVVPNATVVATSISRGVSITRQSNSAGEYDLNPLDADIYTITVTAPGFEKTTQQNVHVNALEVSNVNIALTVGGSDQSVTVSSAPPALETSNATLGATLEHDTYAALPIQQSAYGQAGARRATDFVALLPGVQFNETNGNATTNSGVVNGGGARGAVSDIYINGMPFISAAGEGDPRFVWSAISVDAIDQLQVQTSGYSAIYEGQGVQNYTIKQGTNQFHGSVYEYFRNTILDTWGFFAPAALNPVTGKASKPEEHQNEYGIVLSGPIMKNKMFLFGNYNGYRYSKGPNFQYQTNPNQPELAGNFAGIATAGVYDPNSCPNGNNPSPGVYCQRTRYASGGVNDVIPTASQSKVAQNLQSYLPPLTIPTQLTNNYLGGYKTGLSNFSATGKIDYTLSERHTISFLAAAGRQSTTAPASQTSSTSNATTTFNQSPAPYIDVQEFAPKTKVFLLEDNFTVNPHMVNQFKYGFARYFGPTFNIDQGGAFGAAANGITGLPVGQSSNSFPNVRFTGTGAPNYWGYAGGNIQATNAFTLVDNFNYQLHSHSITLGAQVAWLQYNYQPQTTGNTPLQVTFTNAQTGCYADAVLTGTTLGTPSTTLCYTGTAGHAPSSTIIATSGLPYASYLAGAASAGSFTNSSVAETGARFRPISPYIQDDWKVNSKLTVNIGLRWDYYPTYTEVKNRYSFINANLINAVTGTPGALQTAGSGPIGCNCSTPVHNFYKNFGPRIGFAYSPVPKTVIRASYGVIYAHGGATGGSAISRQGTGLVGFSAAPSFSSASAGLPAFFLDPAKNANGLTIPNYTLPGPPTVNSFGTGYYVGGPSPQSVSYADPYLGDRAPEFVNFTFGIQQALTKDMTLTANYVGSQGHFLQPDSMTARGFYSNQIDPKYAVLGANLSTAVSKLPAGYLAANGISLPYANFDTSQSLAQALKPFAQYNSFSDAYGFVANSNYHALQVTLAQRTAHGVSFMLNYVWSKNIDDAGTFRSGYNIPGSVIIDGISRKADRIERSLSLANQPQHLVITGVFDSPFGHGKLMGDNKYTSAIFGGFKLSTIFMSYSGSPLAITASGAYTNTNSASAVAMPFYNPTYGGGKPRIGGSWGQNITAANPGAISYIDKTAFLTTPPNYMFSNVSRTAPYGLIGPGNYDLDLSLRRVFAMPHYDRVKMTFEAGLYNVTNHVAFGSIGLVVGSSNFGQVGGQANTTRDAQLSARFDF